MCMLCIILAGMVKIHGLFCGCVDKLPGPPQRLRVQVINDNEIMISWDPPVINPHTASSYRFVFHISSKCKHCRLKYTFFSNYLLYLMVFT